jgi:exopolyphosphatase/guanosine-5'-triphosphate,3'-diphosphate pyrophosphatase
VGTAGTATTLAAMDLKIDDYDYGRVHGRVLSLETIRQQYRSLLPMRPEERLLVPGIEKGREDLIIAGSLLTIRTMEFFGFEQMTVSDAGLLEGVLFGLRDSAMCGDPFSGKPDRS